jgi:UDP-N-acetylmuramate dehydrogenase
VATVRELEGLIKIDGILRRDEPMAAHTSFRLGGPADLYAAPRTVAGIADVRRACARADVPCFLLGGGTNLLVADKGVRGVVLDMTLLTGVTVDGGCVTAAAGSPVSSIAEEAARLGLAGLAFAYMLPGTVGGAVWMNARCYDGEISGILAHAEYLAPDGTICRRDMDPAEWAYKRSPFQGMGAPIVSAAFRLAPGDPAVIERAMAGHHADRVQKGHFLYPCAGSVFKNNRLFGAPTGQIVDSLGLKGARRGGAQVAPYHGNIIVNTGAATAADVRALIEHVENEVQRRLGLALEREVILAGEW